MSIVWHVLVLWASHHTLLVYSGRPAHIGLTHCRWPMQQAVREDHFGKIAPDGPPDGSIVVIGLFEHVRPNSGGCWPTKLSEVHWGQFSEQFSEVFCNSCINCRPPACHDLNVPTTSHMLAEHIVLHVLACWTAFHALTTQIFLHAPTVPYTVHGPSEAAGEYAKTTLKSCGRLAIRRSHCSNWLTWTCGVPFWRLLADIALRVPLRPLFRTWILRSTY